MWVKICGTTNLADALLALEHGADALGFIFAPSKRRLTVAQAAAITAQLPASVERVGVFTSADSAEIVATVAAAGLTAVQLHQPHDATLTAELRRQLGPAIRLIQGIGITANAETRPTTGIQEPALQTSAGQAATGENAGRLRSALADPSLWAILLDTEKDGQSGGLGLAFSWQAVQPVLRQVLVEVPPPLIPDERRPVKAQPRVLLAGGLHAGNVQEAIQLLRPFGVDCVSGVEAEPGHKDPARLIAFSRAARREI